MIYWLILIKVQTMTEIEKIHLFIKWLRFI